MHLDIRTLIIVLALATSCSALVFFLMHKLKFSVRGTLFWAYGVNVIACSQLLMALRDYLPDYLSILVANTTMSIGYGLVWSGIRSFLERDNLWRGALAPPLILIPFLYWYTYVSPSTAARVAAVSAILAWQSGGISFDIFRNRINQKIPLTQKIIGYISGINVLSLIIRIVYTLAQPQDTPFMEYGGGTGYIYLWWIAVLFGATSGMIIMISEKIQAQRTLADEAVRRSESKFRSLFEHSRDAVMLLDRIGYLECNPATLHIYGCTKPEDFLGKHPGDFSPPRQPSGKESQIEADRHIATAYEQGGSFFEWTHCRLDGSEFPAEVMLSAVSIGRETVIQALVRDISERKAMEEELRRMASTDPLTGALNRRSFLEKASRELARSRRYGRSLSFLMIDVDHFKRINDQYGHGAGDEVLKGIVEKCLADLRETDIFGRLGGEEFAVLLTETDQYQAMEAAQRLRLGLSSLNVTTDSGPVSLSVSIGLTVMTGMGDNLERLMSRADRALYQAKEKGRDQVVSL